MKIKTYLLAGLLLLGAASCIKDDTEIGDRALSYIQLAGEDTPENYTVDVPNILSIPAPDVKQLNGEKPLSYEWVLEGEVIGTEQTLNYQSGKLGTFQGRLKIYNEDGAYLKKFFITAQSAFTEGVVLLSKTTDGSLLSFMRTDKENAEPVRDAYSAINPTFPLGTTPYCIAYTKSMYGTKSVYVVTDHSGFSVMLDNNTMEVKKTLDAPETPIKKIVSHEDAYYQFGAVGGGKFWDFDYKSSYFVGMSQSQFYDKDGVVPDDCCVFMMSYSTGQQGFVIWDTVKGELWQNITFQYNLAPYTLSSSRYHGYKMFNILLTKQEQGISFFVQNPTKDKTLLVNYTPTILCPYYGGAAGSLERGTFAEFDVTSAGIDDATVFASMLSLTRIYYAKGNKIYSMSTDSGLFTEDPLYTVGTEGDQIVEMLLNPKEDRLYVGVNSPSGENRGSLYGIDITSTAGADPVVLKQPAICGEIASMTYKQK